ncbi:hypothetical protein OIV83_006107 [Microbotryomycetes sp. JL201]|nr:hypothetical protein OIV83_006107 [Microbotryomycetes sp. JL201]
MHRALVSAALAGCFLFQVTLAHIQLISPPAINSKFDPQTPEAKIDYSMTSPLLPDGSNYPCKGYNTPDAFGTLNSVATLQAGSQLNVKLDGTAVHGGGSCQFSISYDQGKTFAVIASIIGGCPIGLQFGVPIPSGLPSANKALFSWTWFNLVGNREEYMNCAIVDIRGGSAQSYTGPTPFRANTFADGTCITVEGQEVVFPNPGPSVQYLGSSSSSSPATQLSNCPFNQNSDVTISPSGSSNPDTKPVEQQPPATTQTDKAVTLPASQTVKPVTSKPPILIVTRTTSTSTAEPTATNSVDSNSGNGPTPGSTSTDSNSSPSGSTQAYLRCDSLKTFSLCGDGRCTFMGSVAAGTVCVDGAIGHERSKRRLAGSNDDRRLQDLSKRHRRQRRVDQLNHHKTRL